MRRNLKKCTLCLQVNEGGGSIDYEIVPKPLTATENGTQRVYTFEVDIDQLSKIVIKVNRLPTHDSNIIVEQLLVNELKITDLNLISFLQTKQGIKKTHGYIDCAGDFVIKLHTNPVSQNFLTYLIQLTKQS